MELEYALLIGIFSALFSFPCLTMVLLIYKSFCTAKTEDPADVKRKLELAQKELQKQSDFEDMRRRTRAARHLQKYNMQLHDLQVPDNKKRQGKEKPRKPRRPFKGDEYEHGMQRVHNNTVERVEMVVARDQEIDDERNKRRQEMRDATASKLHGMQVQKKKTKPRTKKVAPEGLPGQIALEI